MSYNSRRFEYLGSTAEFVEVTNFSEENRIILRDFMHVPELNYTINDVEEQNGVLFVQVGGEWISLQKHEEILKDSEKFGI